MALAVPLEWFIPQNIRRELATPPPPPPENQISPQPRSAFLNYQIQATWQEHSHLGDVMLPWELGINAGQWFASSTFTTRYLQDGGNTETLRQFSSLTWDEPKTLQTLILGDFNAPYTLLGSGGNYGGISWRKNFRLDKSSYSQNYLSINPQKLPLNYALNQASKYVAVGQRSGSVIDFKFTRFMAVEGNLYGQAADGKRIELEALPLEFQVGTDKRESFLGRKGYFYLENLPIGEQLLWVRRAGGDCSVHLTIPDSDKIVSNLGELACTF